MGMSHRPTRRAAWRRLLLLALCLLLAAPALHAQTEPQPDEGAVRPVEPTPAMRDAAQDLERRAEPRRGVIATSSIRTVDRDQLLASLKAGTDFMLRSQLADGNFMYELDYTTGKLTDDDNQVRQAGAVWGLALLHLYQPDAGTAQGLMDGIDFFARNSRIHAGTGGLYPAYPGAADGRTGTVALLTLALVDALRQPEHLPPELKARYTALLERYQTFLAHLQLGDGKFAGGYELETGDPVGMASPYSDGEALLAFIRICKYRQAPAMKPAILRMADRMYETWVVEALSHDPDSPATKGFFQWGIMSFFEIATTDWEVDIRRDWAERSVAMAYWMIDVHQTLMRSKNTGYAYEGIIPAIVMARMLQMQDVEDYFTLVARAGLTKLTSWQVGGPLENRFIRDNPNSDARAVGGVMYGDDDPRLRIDTTQHQMHAVILALTYLMTADNPVARMLPPGEAYTGMPKDAPSIVRPPDAAGEVDGGGAAPR